MASLLDLPSDILVEVLLYSRSPHELHSTILAHRLFLEAFKERRALIIAQVLLNSFRKCPIKNRKVEYAAKIVDKCTRDDGEKVIIYAVLESYMFDSSPTTIASGWAVKLCHAYNRVGNSTVEYKLALLERVYKALLSIEPVKQPFDQLGKSELGLCRELVKVYTARGRMLDRLSLAREVLRRLTSSGSEFREWSDEVIKTYRELQQYDEAVEFGMDQYRLHMSNHDYRGVCEWRRRVVMEFRRNGQNIQAVRHQEIFLADIMPAAEINVYVAWARQLITMQKREGLFAEALAVKAAVWRHLTPAVSCYYGWARELADDHRRLCRKDEALAVMEFMFQETRRQLFMRHRDLELTYHMRQSQWALAAEYASCGRLEEASKVQEMDF